MKIAERIYELRKKAGYSQEELAVKCGVSRQSVSKWESGSAYPEIDKLSLLADIFDVSVDYILGKEAEEKRVITVEVPTSNVYEYKSKWKIGGIPLIHIHLRRRYFWFHASSVKQKRCVAKGIIAIGDIAFGLISLGFLSCGLVSIGLLSIGLFAAGLLGIGVYALGILCVAYMAMGVIAIGVYSFGVIAIALKVAGGVIAIGDVAVGVVARGELVFEDIKLQGRECIAQGSAYDTWVQKAQMPSLLKFALSLLKGC